MREFVHLHVHSEYSLLDGAARVKDLVAQAKEQGSAALAITDHGAMYGVVSFYKECKKQGVKPLIGMETYVAPRSMDDKQGKADKDYGHLVLLAKNEVGYRNLVKLSSIAFTRGFYYRPRIDYEALSAHAEGLVALSACLAGDIPSLLLQNNYAEALALALRLKAMFAPGDFYIELQDHGIPEQKRIIPDLLRICKEAQLKPIATNDVHYVKREDAAAQDALLCIQTGKFVDEENRMKMQTNEFYLKDGDEMASLFAVCPESISNTLEVAEKCNVDFEFGKIHLPSYDVPLGKTNVQYLRELCEEGLTKKCSSCKDEKVYRERLDYELSVVQTMGYVDYFLIVWDFIDYAKRNGIMVGPGRGSAAGSLVAYCLSITDIDPIEHSLLFERFLNPERISMPDIDIDFCYERRQEVIDYVVAKYGEDRVAQIITFGTMAARAAVRDVGRVLRFPYGDVDRIAKLIGGEIGMTIDKALHANAELRSLYQNDPEIKKLIDLALKVEGLPRHASTHAAGVVISALPITEHVPLQKNDEAVTTQFTMGVLEELGLLKMDFLGLRTLTVIRDTLLSIERQGDEVPDLERMAFDDPAVYKLISQGDTDGVFQLESSGMRSFMTQLKPDKFEDIVAGISLFRPGPMEQIPKYVRTKNDPRLIKYQHPLLEPILSMTYGCMVYQEQVMQIVRDLAGYTLAQSDLVRRAMSKKKADVMNKERAHFIEGAAKNHVDEKIANEIFDAMMDFAAYAFNKSHAAAYAVIAYRTGYLKAHYGVEFMASLMNSFLATADKVAEYVYSCKKAGIDILPPDINKSFARFDVERAGSQKSIRFGLAAVRNVGVGACDAIVRERSARGDFTDFFDFIHRAGEFANKRMIESLIKAGAFDSLGHKRSVLYAVHARALDAVSDDRKRNIAGQVSLFDLGDEPVRFESEYPELPEYIPQVLLALEKEVTGLYITGHPLDEYRQELEALGTRSLDIAAANEPGSKYRDNQRVRIGGIITSVRKKTTKSNAVMAYVDAEDLYGMVACLVFPSVLTKYHELIDVDRVVVIGGRINLRDEEPPVLLVDEVEPLLRYAERPKQPLLGGTQIKPSSQKPQRGLYVRHKTGQKEEVLAIVQRYPGSYPVVLACEDGKVLRAPMEYFTSGSEAALSALYTLVGGENVKLVP